MITMKPILEPDVLSLLNNNRFDGPLQGYAITNGTQYLGNCIYLVQGEVITVLDAKADGTENEIPDYSILDGVIRAAVANGQNQGATKFTVLYTTDALKNWCRVFCNSKNIDVPIEQLFGHCEHEG